MPPDRNSGATEPSHGVRYRSPVVSAPAHLRSARSRPARPRTSRTVLAGLGVLAGLVAVGSDAQPSSPAGAAVRDGADPVAVDELDFRQIAQPGASCAQALDGAAPRVIALENGASPVLDEPSFTRLEVDDDVLYADLDGDGADEAVVRATCMFGANGEQGTVQVWRASGRLPMLVDTVAAPPADVAEDSAFPPVIQGVDVDDGELVVTFSHHTDDDPHCCPSEQTVVRYALEGGLEVVGDPVTEAADR